MDAVGYDSAFMFAYSERPDTYAARKLTDDVPEAVKKARLSEIIDRQTATSLARNLARVGRRETVLVEGRSKRSDAQLCGRTDGNQMVVFDRPDVALLPGDYATVEVTAATSATLRGRFVAATTLAVPERHV
jgi:tRNA-2-methylthio-N6-dimethylallyladenosine synthase